jgi:serine carboxypeptidase-like clade 2
MGRNLISYCILLAFLLAAPLTNASALDQAALLRQFIRSRSRGQSADGPAETGPWADPESSFGHLPTDCKKPKGSREADRITALPGQPPRVNFEQYAGYVTVDEEHGRALFYYFVESPYDAASKPLVLWLNGGPGCSSLGAGAMEELGPFRVNPDGKTLSRNRHAWNNVANVIFLESPAGVGFSYSNTSSDYGKSGDLRTAVDSYVFLLHWLERFPEYKGRDFYIAGESYAGHYVPELATVIVAVRKHTGKDPTNLKGIFVGNPFLDNYKNEKGSLKFLWNHGVMSDEMWANITKHCSFGPSDGVSCEEAKSPFNQRNFFNTAGRIDPYNIYAPICIQAPNGTTYSSGYVSTYEYIRCALLLVSL